MSSRAGTKCSAVGVVGAMLGDVTVAHELDQGTFPQTRRIEIRWFQPDIQSHRYEYLSQLEADMENKTSLETRFIADHKVANLQ